MRSECESILATIDWAHATMAAFGATSGYEMDRVMAQTLQRFRGKEGPTRGHFARYLRGVTTPCRSTALDLGTRDDAAALARLTLPLYDVLRVGLDGYRSRTGWETVQQALLDVERRFQRRLTRYHESGNILSSPWADRRFALDLCSYGSSYAATVLLAQAMDFQMSMDAEIQESKEAGGESAAKASPSLRRLDPLVIGQRAYQCIVFSLAAGEFAVTGPLVMARMRQRVIDLIEYEGQRLDTASVDLAGAVWIARQTLSAASAGGSTPSRQRAFIRRWLADSNNAELARITPRRVPVEAALAARGEHPVPLKVNAPERGRFNHRHELGLTARRVLARELGHYVIRAADEGVGSGINTPVCA